MTLRRVSPLPCAVSFVLLASCGTPANRDTAQQEKKSAAPAARRARITQFYASPAVIPPGGKTLLCYGVESASEVKLQPAVEELFPAMARCIEVKPATTTKYVLRAKGNDGAEVSSEATVAVDPKARAASAAPSRTAAPELIQFFTASQMAVRKGAPFTVCYGVKGATSVTLTPAIHPVRPVDRECFTATLDKPTEMNLTATGPGGERDTMLLRIAVE